MSVDVPGYGRAIVLVEHDILHSSLLVIGKPNRTLLHVSLPLLHLHPYQRFKLRPRQLIKQAETVAVRLVMQSMLIYVVHIQARPRGVVKPEAPSLPQIPHSGRKEWLLF